MIPKILHFVWIQGADDMPDEYRRCVESWGRLHRVGWMTTIWDRSSLQWVDNSWIWMIDNPTVQSDVARIEIIRRFGGVYLDCDMECLKPINELLRGRSAFASRRNSERVENAGFGAVPGHQWLRDLTSIVSARKDRISRVLDMDSPFAAALKLHPEVEVLPHHLLHVSRCENEKHLVPDAYAVHHRFSRWMKDDERFAERYAEKEVVHVSSGH